MKETKYQIETYYSARKILEKVKSQNTGFSAEVFAEDQEFTLAKGGIKLFCKIESVNNETLIKVDAINSNHKPSKAIENVQLTFEILQAAIYIGALMLILSFFSKLLMVSVALAISALLGIFFYWNRHKTKKDNLLDKKSIEEQSIEQLTTLVNGGLLD